jgi:hypothetical protein
MRPHKDRQLLPGYQDRALRVGSIVWREVVRRQGKIMWETGEYATTHDVLVQVLGLKEEQHDPKP